MDSATDIINLQQRNKAVIYLVLASVLWSSSGVLIKLIDLNPLAIAGIRGAIAAATLLAASRRRLSLNFSAPQLCGAATYALTVIFFVTAVKMTTAANAILLQYTAPVFTALLGIWFLQEMVSRIDWCILALVMGGIFLFFLDELAPGALLGNILSLLSGLTFSVFMLCMRKQKSGSPVETVILGNMITALVCIPFYFQGIPTPLEWTALGFLGIFQLGLPFLLYSVAIKQLTALDAILIQVLEPLLNPVWVLLVIGETPGPWAAVGGALVLASVTGRSIYQNKLARRKIKAEQQERPAEKIAGCVG